MPSKVTAPAEKPLLDVKADAKTGKIIATLPKPDEDGVSGRYIYLTQLGTGLGSAPIGLDRALSSSTRILVFRRIGKKVAAEVENSKFVASSPDPGERRIARESFATSVLWMGDVIDTRTDGRSPSIFPASSPATISTLRQPSRTGVGAISSLRPS